MKTRKLKEEEKEQGLTCLCHIIDDIMTYAKNNHLSAKDAAIAIAGWISLISQEENNETGSSCDKYKGTDPELDQ